MKLLLNRMFCNVIALVFACSIILTAGMGHASDNNSSDPVRVSIQNNPNFANLRGQLQSIVNILGFHLVNQFCVVAYTSIGDHNDPLAYIYWPVENKLIEWDTGSNQPILYSARIYDLGRDILPDGAMTIDNLHRSDVKSILHDCEKYGTDYKINKYAGGWISISKLLQFSSVNSQLQYLVDNDANQIINKFCIIGQKKFGFSEAYVYWRTNHELIIWLPEKYDVDDPFAVTNSDVVINLLHGLRNAGDANDDRSEMQKSYAQYVVKACRQLGDNFIITKSNSKRISQ